MFRVSPWITYGPDAQHPQPHQPPSPPRPHDPQSIVTGTMDSDADMDAPHISTLRDEASPPPNSTRTGRFRVKLLVNEKRPGTKFISFNGQTGEEAGVSDADVDVEGDDGDDDKTTGNKEEQEPSEEEDEGEGEEEDQLIDDDDQPTVGSSTPSPRKAAATKRGRGKATGKRKRVENAAEASPPEKPPKKKAAVKAAPAAQKTTRKASAKTKTTIVIPPLADIPPAELSEGFTGTAPSSPAHDPPSPTASAAPSASASAFSASMSALPFSESEVPPPTTVTAPLPPSADPLLQTPLPRYPLPTKPFPVQAVPKIATGYAPALPLDRSGKKPRHWRMANREIRGIAGGRWFARSWVGDKESELTTVSAPQAPPHVVSISALTLPKLPALTLAPGGKGRGKKHEVVSTPTSSRSVSAVPEVQARPAKKKSGLSKATPLPEEDMDDYESLDGV
ncbi:hypothetical protein OF83DRAFT_1167078 [Amylostereum chailletii]|nr:hypothetical protein OF83DRAFT_1167078 [Amylostereum chailletii]